MIARLRDSRAFFLLNFYTPAENGSLHFARAQCIIDVVRCACGRVAAKEEI